MLKIAIGAPEGATPYTIEGQYVRALTEALRSLQSAIDISTLQPSITEKTGDHVHHSFAADENELDHGQIHTVFDVRGKASWSAELRHLIRRPVTQTGGTMLVPSDATRKRLARIQRISLDQIHVIGLPPLDLYSTMPQLAIVELVKKRLQLPERFIVMVGSLVDVKSLQRLIDAFGSVQETLHDDEVQLLIVQRESASLSENATKRAFEHTEKMVEDNPLIRTIVPQQPESLASLYHLARAAVAVGSDFSAQRSIIEAQSAGAPVVVAKRALHDDTQEHCITVPQQSTKRFARALISALARSPKQKKMIAAAMASAQRFSWDDAARSYEGFYEQLAKEH